MSAIKNYYHDEICNGPDYDETPEYYCTDCGERCNTVEETFDYAGTHCTFGQSGTHRTGHYVSSCCSAEVTEDMPEDKDEL